MKLNLKNIINTLKDVRNYVFPIKRIFNKFKNISSEEDLKDFIQERSAHVTQTTLYGYVKTRIGSRYGIMFEDEKFVESINIAKWNIYMSALSDCTLYTYSYLIDKKNFKENNAEILFNSIIENEKNNGLNNELYEQTKIKFKQRLNSIDWKQYYKNQPFSQSSDALYKWSPIADELKLLDKQIVLNSMLLKWNLIKNEFKELTKNLNSN